MLTEGTVLWLSHVALPSLRCLPVLLWYLRLHLPPAAADLDGHYTATATYPDGHQVHCDWFFTPCGVGCSSVKGLGQANLFNGQWTLDGQGGVSCEEGGGVHDAMNFLYAWDPARLAGTVVLTTTVPVCGHPSGYAGTQQLHLQLAS